MGLFHRARPCERPLRNRRQRDRRFRTAIAVGAPAGGKLGITLSDLSAYAVIILRYDKPVNLAALARRNETGRGDYIDIAMLDVQVGFLANQAMNYLVSGKPPRRSGNAHPTRRAG